MQGHLPKTKRRKVYEKTLLLLLTVIMIFTLVSCNSKKMETKNKFTRLGDAEILTIGTTGTRFMNYEKETVTVKELTYTLAVTYTLHKATYDYGESVLYGGYYYYWTTSNQTETQELGKQTTKKTYIYEYLPYKENENVAVKTNVLTKVSFDYEGGWIEKNVDVTTILNGYFDSFEALKLACPQIAELIDTKPTRKYYVDVTVPDNLVSSEEFYDSYYYIEEK